MSFPFAMLGWVALGAVIGMTITWEVQRRTANAGYVDAAWAALLGLAAIFYAFTANGATLPRALTAVFGALWGFRLALHLLNRVRHESEDGRYRHLREHWHGDQRKFFAFFMAQALLLVLFSVPFLIAASNPVAAWTGWTTLAVAIWLAGLGGEALADAQLARWRADPANRGRTCRAGLWRYSRHPNYFFEWLHWFAWVALAVGGPWWWVALFGPALMGASLAWVTGIPYTEANALRSRGDDYRAYQRETSAFFPWFPRT